VATPISGLRFATLATNTGEAFLIVEKKHTENFTILYVEGLIKLGESAEFFSAALEGVLKNESTNVIVDFTKIDYIDSTGIGELVGYLGKFTNQNRKLILVNPSERILKLLKLAKLDAVFKIYSSEDEAIAAESGSAAKTA
jgi:anti-anti-sigma factor